MPVIAARLAKIEVMSTTDTTPDSATDWPSSFVRQARRGAPFFLVAGFVLAFDQLTKAAVRDWLAIGESWPSDGWLVKITHVTNSGAAFGILEDAALFLTITAVIAIGAIVFYYLFLPLEHGLLRVAMGLLLGGAAGNLVDRVRFGHVTDFIDFPRYPEFNVADSSIVIALFVIGGFFLFFDKSQHEGNADGG